MPQNLPSIRKLIAASVAAALTFGIAVGSLFYDHPAEVIVGHHQAGPAWKTPAQADAHFDAHGYADVAYNAMITPDGQTWPGRPESAMSAANKGLNAKAVAFCFLGDLDKAPATDPAIRAAGAWLKGARQRHPRATVIVHGDVARLVGDRSVATACPGRYGRLAVRAAWLYGPCGLPLAEAKRRAAAGK